MPNSLLRQVSEYQSTAVTAVLTPTNGNNSSTAATPYPTIDPMDLTNNLTQLTIDPRLAVSHGTHATAFITTFLWAQGKVRDKKDNTLTQV